MQAKNRKMGRAMNLHAVKSPISFENIRTETEINAVIARLNQEIKVARSESEKERIQYTRQCAYNRKKKIIKEGKKENGIGNMGKHKTITRSNSSRHNNNNIIYSIDDSINDLGSPRISERPLEKKIKITYLQIITMAKNAAPVALFSICALTSLTFVYMQSVPLYASSGFTNPELCAFGALLMIVGFSLIHALNKSKLALILCLYASAYEVTLIAQGTFKNEATTISTNISTDPNIIFLREKTQNLYDSYKISNEKYQNIDSNVFHNAWFNTTQVVPAWQKYEKAQKELDIKKAEKNEHLSGSSTGFLKLSYRLGLVFLCMISIHNLIKVTIKDKQ